MSTAPVDQERYNVFDVLDGAVDALLGGSAAAMAAAVTWSLQTHAVVDVTLSNGERVVVRATEVSRAS